MKFNEMNSTGKPVYTFKCNTDEATSMHLIRRTLACTSTNDDSVTIAQLLDGHVLTHAGVQALVSA
jgi:hypothetical protein